MAAPTYTWEYVENLFGLTPPKVATFEASSGLETKVGTLLILTGGQLDEATASVVLPIGLAMQATTAAATAADPIKVLILRPGDIIKGTADADASALSGFSGKLGDFNSDGSFDVGDTSGGCASVWRTEDSGLTVYLTFSKFSFVA
jgi:hypothetical protein